MLIFIEISHKTHKECVTCSGKIKEHFNLQKAKKQVIILKVIMI